MLINIFFRLRQLLRSFPILMPLAYPLYRFIGLLYASQIPLRADFSDQPTFKHGLYGIFIAGGAKIGRGCTFFQHVTIGGISSTEERSGAPIIGDNCVLYPGCKIVGRVNIGNNCKIGPNVVVWEDLPDNTTVVFSREAFRKI